MTAYHAKVATMAPASVDGYSLIAPGALNWQKHGVYFFRKATGEYARIVRIGTQAQKSCSHLRHCEQ